MPEVSSISLFDKVFISINTPMNIPEIKKVLKEWQSALKVYVTGDGYKRIGFNSGNFQFVKVIDARQNRGKWLYR